MSMSTNEGNVTRVTVDLTISGAYREDTTNYICSASNLLNRVTRNVSLIVQCMQVTYAHVLKSINTLYRQKIMNSKIFVIEKIFMNVTSKIVYHFKVLLSLSTTLL